MPNHVTNIVTIIGDAEKVEELIQYVKVDKFKEEKGLKNLTEIIGAEAIEEIQNLETLEEVLEHEKVKSNLSEKEIQNLLTFLSHHSKVEGLQPLTLDEKKGIIFGKIRYLQPAEYKEIDGSGTIDFNKITPTPKWVFQGNLGKEEKEKYGDDNCWYEWNIKNWGTKWNAYDCIPFSSRFDPSEKNIIRFNTAWSAPVELIRKLSLIFPEVEIKHEYADEDFGSNCGRLRFKDNVILENFNPPYGIESRQLAAQILEADASDYGYNEDWSEKTDDESDDESDDEELETVLSEIASNISKTIVVDKNGTLGLDFTRIGDSIFSEELQNQFKQEMGGSIQDVLSEGNKNESKD